MTTDILYDAQMCKLKHIIERADIRTGHRVLEIGTGMRHSPCLLQTFSQRYCVGWGSLAILAVQLTGCTVDTITLSSEQASLARKRIDALGLSASITVHLMDYRDIPREWDGQFDRFVSIEVIEAIGRQFLDVYWRIVDRVLKKKNAVGVVQVITIPEASKLFVV